MLACAVTWASYGGAAPLDHVHFLAMTDSAELSLHARLQFKLHEAPPAQRAAPC